jgi:hypothetical protein
MRRARASLALPLALVLVLALAAPVASVGHSGAAVYPPNARPNGLSLSDLAILWGHWSWQAADTNPLLNPRCEYSGVGQIWLAPVSIGGEFEVDCTLPAGAKLLITPGGYECSTAEGNGETLAELTECANTNISFICCVEAWVDGVAVENIDRYLLTTPGQVLEGPNLFGEEDTLSVERGWFILVRPMSVGEHVVVIYDEAHDFGLIFGMTFNITVVPGG